MQQEEASASRKLRIQRNSKHQSATDTRQQETLQWKLGFEAHKHWTHFEMPHMSTRSQTGHPIHTIIPLQVLASVAFILCIATSGPGKNLLDIFRVGLQARYIVPSKTWVRVQVGYTRPCMCRVNQGK